MRLEDLRTEGDLERLDPVTRAQLESEPATRFDLLRLRLEVADAIKAQGKALERAISDATRRTERRRDRGGE